MSPELPVGSEKSWGQRVLEWIPGTHAHAHRRTKQLFDENSFDPSRLTAYEAGVLRDSVNQKYVPALRQSNRAKALGVLVGAVAPESFLLIGAVTLAASAGSTTGAWYSITLKEMKAKFERMGLSLTANLLQADMLANSFSMCAGIGYAHRTIAFPAIVDAMHNPTLESVVHASVACITSGVVHRILAMVLEKKERAAIQFDFNDATLGGATEKQQRFFAKAISEVENSLAALRQDRLGVNLNRYLLTCMQALIRLVEELDVNNQHSDSFQEVQNDCSREQNNYEPDLRPFSQLVTQIIGKISNILDLDAEMAALVQEKIGIMKNIMMKDDIGEREGEVVKAIVSDVVPELLKFMESKGENGIKSNVSNTATV